MFLGHFAVGFASKRAAPRASLGVLMAAPLFLDLLWPIFLIAGVESVRIEPGNTAVTPLDLHDYPWSHSLATSLAWSAVFAAAFWAATRYGARRRRARGGRVQSFRARFRDPSAGHAALPGQPDLRRPRALEFTAGDAGGRVRAVRRRCRDLRAHDARASTGGARSRCGPWSCCWPVLYVTTFFGPPPPSVDMIKYGGLTGWLFVPWAWWIDRNRVHARPAPRPASSRRCTGRARRAAARRAGRRGGRWASGRPRARRRSAPAG